MVLVFVVVIVRGRQKRVCLEVVTKDIFAFCFIANILLDESGFR